MAIEAHIHAFPRHVEGKIYPEAVPVYDKATGRIRIGDGVTEGGKEIPTREDLNALEEQLTNLTEGMENASASIDTAIGEEV